MGNIFSSGASQVLGLNNLNVFTAGQRQDNDSAFRQIEHFGQRIKADGSDDLAIDILGNLIANDDKNISQRATDTLIDIYLSPETDSEVKSQIKESIYHIMDKIADSDQALFDGKNISDSRLYYIAAAFSKENYAGQSIQFVDSFSKAIKAKSEDEDLTCLAQAPLQSGRFTTHAELASYLTQLSDNGKNFLFKDDLVNNKNIDVKAYLDQLSADLSPGDVALMPMWNKEHWTVLVVQKSAQGEPADAYYFDSNVINSDDPQHVYPKNIRDMLDDSPSDKNIALRVKGYCLQVSQEYSAGSAASNGCGAFVGLLARSIAQSKLTAEESTGDVGKLIDAIASTAKPILEQELGDIRELMILSLLTNHPSCLA